MECKMTSHGSRFSPRVNIRKWNIFVCFVWATLLDISETWSSIRIDLFLSYHVTGKKNKKKNTKNTSVEKMFLVIFENYFQNMGATAGKHTTRVEIPIQYQSYQRAVNYKLKCNFLNLDWNSKTKLLSSKYLYTWLKTAFSKSFVMKELILAYY